jgi:signal transduction histidine kinase
VFSSLRVRLLVSFLLVALVAVGAVAAFASQTTSGQFRGYVERRTELGGRRYLREIEVYYVQNGSWIGVQATVEKLGQISGDQIVLVDSSANVVADSAGGLLGHHADSGWVGGPIPIMVPGAEPASGPDRVTPGSAEANPGPSIGAIYVNPLANQEAEASFLGAVNRWLLIAAGAAGLLAVVLTFFISQRMLKPIEALTSAAQRMARGDLSSRVEVPGSDEIGKLANAFNAMAEALAKNEQLRRHMVSDVAHELRTPLTNVRGYLEALQDGVLEANADTLRLVAEEAQLLGRLVEDLQELAVAEAGQLRLERQQVELPGVIGQVVDAARLQFVSRGLTLKTELPEGLPAVDADPERVGQVVRNLLSNALAHTEPGGEVTVSARKTGSEIEVSVRDTGTGIDSEDLPYVFERFYRADRSRARKSGGAGLGLAIARQLVEAHGGRISADSCVGTGSTFRFTLPMS